MHACGPKLTFIYIVVLATSILSHTMASVFDEGNFPVKFITEETPFSSCFDSSAPPKPLLIATPTVNGNYPIILLLHGFYLRNYFYKGLLQHIASHGFIAVAPQV